MNKTILKAIITVLSVTMMTAGVATLTSCKSTDKNKTNGTDTTSSESLGTASTSGSSTSTPPTMLPSVAKGTMAINNLTIPAVEFDFYYYTIYSSYAQYASYGSLPTVAADGSLDLTALCNLPGYETLNWGDYLMNYSQRQLQDSYIFSDYAAKEGMTLTADDQKTIDSFFTSVQSYADQYSMSLDDYLKTMYGANATKENLIPVVSRFLLADRYLTDVKSKYSFTDAELLAFYTANKDSYKNTDLPTVRHILFLATVGVSGYTDATADQLAAAKALADAALAKVNTYQDMITVGDAAKADGTATESAEYKGIKTGDMVPEFETWCFDASRKPGDKAVVKTEYGYHVMYYIGTQKDWMNDALKSLTDTKFNAYLTENEALPQYKLVIS